MAERIILEERKLGNITLVDPESKFPWDLFSGGEINCVFQTVPTAVNLNNGLNDIRIWLHINVEDQIYLERSKYRPTTYIIAFVDPNDAVKFITRFGDVVKRYTI